MPSVLIVDDNFSIRTMYTMLFETHGFKVESAINGWEALEALKGNLPDVMILDVNLPGGMSGLDLLAQIRDDHALKSLPVIIISSDARFEYTDEAKLATLIMSKPLSLVSLMKQVERLLSADVTVNGWNSVSAWS